MGYVALKSRSHIMKSSGEAIEANGDAGLKGRISTLFTVFKNAF